MLDDRQPTYCNDGSTITKIGNNMFTDGHGTYTRQGSMLIGPQGLISNNVGSSEEAKGILIGMHGGKKF